MKLFENYNWSTFRILALISLSAFFVQFFDGLLSMGPSTYTLSQILVFSAVNMIGVLLVSFIGVFASSRANIPLFLYRNFLPSIFIGFLIAVLAVGLDFIVFDGAIVKKVNTMGGIASRLGLAYSAAIGEEVFFRLCIMSLLILLTRKILNSSDASIWIAILVSSLFFSLAHTPRDSHVLDLSMVFRALLLNGGAGIVFGWMFWRRGLLAAFVTHFSADFAIYVIFPFFWRFVGKT